MWYSNSLLSSLWNIKIRFFKLNFNWCAKLFITSIFSLAYKIKYKFLGSVVNRHVRWTAPTNFVGICISIIYIIVIAITIAIDLGIDISIVIAIGIGITIAIVIAIDILSLLLTIAIGIVIAITIV